jgi:branched-chain amino acid transport system substrate-binding protein
MWGKAAALAAMMAFAVAPAHAETTGVTESEIKIGATFPFSGPASPLSNTGKGLIAYVTSVNDPRRDQRAQDQPDHL